MNVKEIDELLDVFVNMFIDPIISDENLSAEVNSVNSEFEINHTNEDMHINEV